MISLFNIRLEQNGFVQGLVVTNFTPIFTPCFIWVDGKCARVSALLSWEYCNKKLLQLVEINNGCQVLIEYSNLQSIDSTQNKCSYKTKIIIPERTSENNNNSELWDNYKRISCNVEYPYIYLYHHTEEDKYPLIISSQLLKSSDWNLAGVEKLKMSFSNMTDIKEIKYTFDFWPLAMKQNDGCNVMIRDDYGTAINADIYVTNRTLNKSLKFKVDTRLLMPCHIIHHNQMSGEWWEYYFPHIYRICCSGIKLKAIEDYYLVDKDQLIDYKPSKGFMLADGEETSLLQMLLYETNIYDFFD